MSDLTEYELAEIDALIHGRSPPTAPPGNSVTAETLGDWLGLTKNRIHALARDGVIPRNPDKTFPLRPAILAYCEHCRAGSVGRTANSELAAEKLRLAKEQADKIAFSNARARAELLDSREVADAWRGVVTDLRAAVLAVPSRVAANLGLDRKEAAALESEIRDSMEAIANDD